MSFQPLTDLQWQILEPFFPNPVKRGRGKPHTPWRNVINSILYVLSTSSKWESLPKSEGFASRSAAHRWYKLWKKSGLLDELLLKLREFSVLANELKFPSTRLRMPKSMPQVSPQAN